MILKHDDCRLLAVPIASLPSYRRAVEDAITALGREYGPEIGKPYTLTVQQAVNLRRLHRLHVILHEED